MRTVRFARWLLLALFLIAVPVGSRAGLIFSVGIAPPILPVYAQPICPTPGYIWTPGYWAYGDEGYFWVPGTWAPPPYIGALWTPGYWGWGGGVYLWHGGYWGRHIGFYGGVNYGFGYGGFGYEGGYWNHGEFSYNRAVTNVNTTIIHNTYNKTVINNNGGANRVSYNGGRGGLAARATPVEMSAAREQHAPPTALQTQHVNMASANRSQLYSVNRGTPTVTASPRPAAFAAVANTPARSGAGMQMNHPVPNAARPGGVNAPVARPNSASSYHPAPNTPAARPGGFSTPVARPNQASTYHPAPSTTQAQRPQFNSARPTPNPPARSYPQARPAQQKPHYQSQPRPQSAPRMQSAPRAPQHQAAAPAHGGHH